MNCHSCPHHEAVKRGEYDSKPWNEAPCSGCKLGEDTFYSVPLDEENPPASALPPSGDSSAMPDTVAEQLVFGSLVTFFDSLLSLPSEQRDIVAWRFQGVSYKEIAERQGTSVQLAEMRHKIALKKYPVLRKLFPEKVAKRRRRLSKR
jgi:hypothetical protein